MKCPHAGGFRLLIHAANRSSKQTAMLFGGTPAEVQASQAGMQVHSL